MRRLTLAAATVLATAFTAPATAQSAKQDAQGWQFELTPYLWAPALKGSVQINNAPKAKLDLSAWDLIQMLDFSAAGRFEARNGRWTAFANVFYAKVSDGGDGEIKLRQRGPDRDVREELVGPLHRRAGADPHRGQMVAARLW